MLKLYNNRSALKVQKLKIAVFLYVVGMGQVKVDKNFLK
jgi:hypothetical protein